MGLDGNLNLASWIDIWGQRVRLATSFALVVLIDLLHLHAPSRQKNLKSDLIHRSYAMTIYCSRSRSFMFYSVNNGSLKIIDEVIPPCCGTLSSILWITMNSLYIVSQSFSDALVEQLASSSCNPSVPSVPLGSALDVSDATGELRNASVDWLPLSRCETGMFPETGILSSSREVQFLEQLFFPSV